MEIDEFKRGIVHFVGCGGAGMAPLAAILTEKGFRVSGSDLEEGKRVAWLKKLGITVRVGHAAGNLPEVAVLVVYSSAVSPDNPEMRAAAAKHLPAMCRGRLLAELAATYKRPVAISGSHGKTTVTAMLVHILRNNGVACGFMIGGDPAGGTPAGAAGDGDVFITEADESDGTHTLIKPFLGVVPNVEDDHAWSVGGEAKLFANFRDFGRRCARLVYLRTPACEQLYSDHGNALGLAPDGLSLSSLPCEKLSGWGPFQVRNGALAVAAAVELGISREAAESVLLSFPGVARRMTMHYESPELAIIEDYAHHPTEVAAALEAIAARWPDRYLRVVFQPHRFARLRKYLDGFAQELSHADAVIVTPVFAAWTESGPVNAGTLAAGIGTKAVAAGNDWQAVATAAAAAAPDGRPVILAVLGAGDINRIFEYLPS